jgi:hypothetical protein
MIAIKINGEFLDMPEKFKINFVKCNPLFASGLIEGDFTYNFTLPLTSKNMQIFGFPHVLNIYANPLEYECELYLDEIQWTYAILTIVSNTPDAVKCNLVTNGSDFVKVTAPKKLKQIEYDCSGLIPEAKIFGLYLIKGLKNTADTITFDLGVPPIGGLYTYIAPYNGDMYETLEQLKNLVNAQTSSHKFTAEIKRYRTYAGYDVCWFYVEKEFVNNNEYIPITMSFSTGNVSQYVAPLLNERTYFPWAIDHLIIHMNNMFEWKGWEHYREWFTERQYCFPMMMNTDYYGSGDAASNVIINNYKQLHNTYEINQAETIGIPFLFLKYVVESVLADAGYSLKGSFFNDTEIQKLILYNNFGLGYSDYDAYKLYSVIIDAINHLPDCTCGDLLNAIKSMFSLSIIFRKKDHSCYIDPSKEILQSILYNDLTHRAEPYTESEYIVKKGLTFSFNFDSGDAYTTEYIKSLSEFNIKGAKVSADDLPTTGNYPGDIRFVANMNMWCYWNDDTSEWKALSQNLMEKVIGDGETQIQVNASPVFIRHKPYNPTTSAEMQQLMGWISQSGNAKISTKTVSNPNFGIRLLFWRGLDADEVGAAYPLASYEPYNFNFDKNWNYSLQWETENGLINKWWKEYIRFWNSTRMVTYRMILSAHELIMLDEREKIRIDGIDYLMKEMRISFSQNGIEKIEADLYMVNMRAQIGQLYEEYPIEEEPEEGGE